MVARPVFLPTIIAPRPCVTPVLYQATLVPLCVSKPASVLPVIATATTTLQRPSWLSSAVQLIDLMVQQGGVEEGLQACKQLIRVRDQLPAEIYWRAAALAAVSGRDSDEIVALLHSAQKAGDRFEARQLPGGSLRAYLRSANAQSLDESLNRLATVAMTSSNPGSDYLALSAMLALDGQSERARLFLAAASKPTTSTQTASSSTAFNMSDQFAATHEIPALNR